MLKRVFFSFHYEDIEGFRGDIIKTCLNKGRGTIFHDNSLWTHEIESSFDTVKSKIDAALRKSEVTVLLIGTHTFSRFWVKYEIEESLKLKNKLIGIHINSIAPAVGCIEPEGKNPFEHLECKAEIYDWTLDNAEENLFSWLK